MSSLDFLERLLDGVAVEWTVLGDERFVEVANTARRPVKASLRLSGVTPYYGANNIQDYVDGYTHDGEYVLIAEDGSASLENYSVQFATGKFWANNHVHVVRGKNKLSTRFLYHYLQTVDFMPYLPNKDRSKLTKGEMIKIPLPVPCPEDTEKSLKIQFEIVRILDAFTAMTAELTAELTARKKQYNYYRDQLLSFEEGVPLLPLSQCCESIADGDHQAPQKTEVGIPFITISDVSATNQIDFSNTKFVSASYYAGLDSKRKARTNDILYTVVGSYGIPIYIDSNKNFAFQRHIAILRPNPSIVISKYMYHALRSSNVLKQAHNLATGAAQKTITLTALHRMQIAVPSLEEQARIVSILDKFDALSNSISEGLPREIELRQKQYEYYRDLLLSFPKPEAA